MTNLDLICLSNLMTDIIININEEELNELDLKKGGYKSFSKVNRSVLEKILLNKTQRLSCAGSPANVAFNSKFLGMKVGLFGTIGNDQIGDDYINSVKKKKIKHFINQTIGESGTCYIMITPDGERSIIANLGVGGKFNLDFDRLNKTKIFHTSAYELIQDTDKILEAIHYLRIKNFKNKYRTISFDLADKSIVNKRKESIYEILKLTDILFMTEEEATALTNLDPLNALEELSYIVPYIALKKGKNGSTVKSGHQTIDIKTYETKIVNTCGAGDAYTSGFLFSFLEDSSLEECGNNASLTASKICSIKESHL